MGSLSNYGDSLYGESLRLGTPMRPSTVASAYRSSFDLLPGRPPTTPLSMASVEEAEEAEYASRMLKSATMPYLYRPVAAMPRGPSVRYVREEEEALYELSMVDRLPNLQKTPGAGYDIAGSNVFDLTAVFGPKPGKGARRPRTFSVAPDVESPR